MRINFVRVSWIFFWLDFRIVQPMRIDMNAGNCSGTTLESSVTEA